MRAPVGSQHAIHLVAQALLDGAHGFVYSVIVLEGAEMFVEISRAAGAATECVNLGATQAVEVIELHRRERRAQLHKLVRRFIQLPALVIRADDENPHIAGACGLNRRPVQVVDEVPVDVEVIEIAVVNCFQDNICGGMGGESDEPDATLFLELARRGETTVRSEGVLDQLAVIYAVQRQ